MKELEKYIKAKEELLWQFGLTGICGDIRDFTDVKWEHSDFYIRWYDEGEEYSEELSRYYTDYKNKYTLAVGKDCCWDEYAYIFDNSKEIK